MKNSIKKVLSGLGILKLVQEIRYKMSFLNGKSTHPRKLVHVFYRQFVKKGQLVFDIGANVGERVVVFNELSAKTVAVEPQVHCVEKMEKRFAGNTSVHLENVGLGERQGEMDFYICDDDDRLSTFSNDQMENSFFSGSTRWNRKVVVKILTLEDLIAKYGVPAFCKIDVEGYELNVLKGLKTPIPALSMEFSSKQLGVAEDCMQLLSGISGNYKFNVCFGEPYGMHFKEWVSRDEVIREIERQDKLAATHAWGDIYATIAQ